MLFGTNPVPISEITATVLSQFLKGLPREAQTAAVRHALQKLGVARGFRVAGNSLSGEDDDGHWRLDLAWWQPGQGTLLACQCEWGKSGDMLRKFERLLAVKAPLKLMVVRSRRAGAERQDVLFRTDTEAILKVLGTALIDFAQHVAGETYVLLERLESDSKFCAYEFCVPADGKLDRDFSDAASLFRPIELTATAGG